MILSSTLVSDSENEAGDMQNIIIEVDDHLGALARWFIGCYSSTSFHWGKPSVRQASFLARAWGRFRNRARRSLSEGRSTRIAPQLDIENSWWTRDVTLKMLNIAFVLIPFITRNGPNVPVNTHRPCPSFSVKVFPIPHHIYGPGPGPLVPHAPSSSWRRYESPC